MQLIGERSKSKAKCSPNDVLPLPLCTFLKRRVRGSFSRGYESSREKRARSNLLIDALSISDSVLSRLDMQDRGLLGAQAIRKRTSEHGKAQFILLKDSSCLCQAEQQCTSTAHQYMHPVARTPDTQPKLRSQLVRDSVAVRSQARRTGWLEVYVSVL